MVALKKFGTPLNQAIPKEPTAYKGKVPRGEEPLGPHTGFDPSQEYADTYVCDEHNSAFHRIGWGPDAKKGAHEEKVDGNGCGFIQGGDGSRLTFQGGTSNFHGKNGGISTFNSNMDSATYGGAREVTGTDKQAGGKHLSRGPGGAKYSESFGYNAKYAAMETAATSAASGRSSSHIGKYTVNAEGGIGFGVNKSSSMKAFMRMEPDGTFHVQVTPKGQEGGAAVVKINPDGSILITSESTLTVQTEGTQTFKAPHIVLDSEVFVTKHLEASEYLKAPFCHSCADKAKSSC